MPKVSLPELMRDLKDGVITPSQYVNYQKTGSLGPRNDAPQLPVPSELQERSPHSFMVPPDASTTVAGVPHSLIGPTGALLGTGAALATGGGSLTALLAGAGGATSKTPGDVAQNTVLSGLAPRLPSAGSSRIIQALKGAAAGGATSIAGQEAKSLVDNQSLTMPNAAQTGISAALGGVAGAAGARPAGAPTDAQQEALAYQQQVRDAAEQQKVVRKLQNATEPLRTKAENAAKAAREAQADSKAAASNLKTQAERVATFDKSGYAAQQAKYASDIHANSVSVGKAQEALDDASRALKSHESDMTAAEVAVQKQAIASLKDKVTSLQNKNTMISAGRNSDGTILKAAEVPSSSGPTRKDLADLESQLADLKAKAGNDPNSLYAHAAMQGEKQVAQVRAAVEASEVAKAAQEATTTAKLAKAQNTVNGRLASNQAGDIGSGATPVDFEHPPDVTNKHVDLWMKQQEAAEALKTQQEAADSLRQQKLDHAAAYKGKAGANVPEEHYTAVDDALKAAEDARAAARAAREAHLDHLDTVAQEKNKAIDMEPESPAGETNAVGKLGSILSRLGTHGKMVGVPLEVAGALSSLSKQTKAPEPPGILKQILMDKLGANANTLQPASPAIPDLLRQLLSQSQAQPEQ